MSKFKKLLVGLGVSLALALGVNAVDAATSVDKADAAFAGSCGWSLNVGVQHWSPAYGVYYWYQRTLYVSSRSRFMRQYLVYSPLSGISDYWYVAC